MKKYKILASIFYFAALLFFIISFFNLNNSEFTAIFLLLVGCIFTHLGGVVLFKFCNFNKILKSNMYIYFIIYILLLIYLFFLMPLYGRNKIDFGFNIVPFSTIKMYLNDFNSIKDSKVILNLIGNFICLIPLSFFLKKIFKSQNKIFIFLLTILLCAFSIEIMQYITKTGSCDIDDVILNSSGAIISYFIFKIKSIDLLLNNILFLENNKISKMSIILTLIFVLIIVLSIVGIIMYRNKLYNNNYDDYNKIYNPTITFEYNNSCSQNNLFYEDELYKYYFSCLDNEAFYVVINNEDKVHIKNLIDNSKYNVDITRLLSIMESKEISYKKENKYDYFTIELDNSKLDNISFAGIMDVEIAKLNIINIGKKDSKELYEVNIIPLKKGTKTVNIKFEFYDENAVLVDKIFKTVKISIDSNLKVKYEIL